MKLPKRPKWVAPPIRVTIGYPSNCNPPPPREGIELPLRLLFLGDYTA
jgi:hypothetical protein